ncbi:MAG TPA: hypothetical protein VL068_09545, partial [Microthrixaceae bacterium]|nr:hypothetical protein [Microthrixaceae bacterium]
MLRSRLLTCSLGLLAILCVAMAAPAGAEMVPTGSTSQSSQSARQAGRVTASTPAPAAPFSGVAPARLFDTRSTGGTIDGIGQGGGAFAGTRSVQVTGRGEVPLAGVGAVVLNLTVTNPATDGYTTVFPGGSARPNASSVNFSAGSTVPNAVIAKVGPTGSVSIYNSTRADVIIDVSGWIPDDADYTGADPARFTDTRSGRTTVDGQEQGRGAFSGVRKVQLAGRGGIPSSGVGAVVLNLTITGSAGEGYSTIYPGGEARPATSNLNFIKGGTRASLVIVKVGESGTAELFNSVRADAIVDVLGWFPSGSDYSSLVPARLVDTRPGRQTTDGLEIGAGAFSGTRSFVVADRAGVPADAGAVVLNVTVTGSGASGYTTEFVTGETIPKTSNLNYNKGQSAANLVIARIGVNGQVNIFNSSSAHIVIDVLGWLPKSPAGPDAKAGTTGMVSVASDGTQANNGSISSAVSADGRYVAYMGDASNLVPNDTNGEFDVFLYDRHTATTTRVSVGAGGVQANGSSYYPTLSADGRYIAYSSDATNLVEGDTNDEADVFVYDQLAKVATRVSVASDGGQSDGSSYQPSISGDGTVVAFVSVASNLVAGDSNGAADVYVHDRESGSTTRVSISDNGDEAEADSSKPSISGDGLSVAFESMASNLVADDTNSAMDIF